MTSCAVRGVTTTARRRRMAVVVMPVVMPLTFRALDSAGAVPAEREEATTMEDLRDAGHGTSADSLAFFRDHRERLGAITQATVSFPGLGADDPYCLVLRDGHGRRMLLSGCTAGYAGTGPRAAMQVLVEAGFAAHYAEVVFTHNIVRLSRSRDGATTLERATREALPGDVGCVAVRSQ